MTTSGMNNPTGLSESPDAKRTPHIGLADQIIIYKSPKTRDTRVYTTAASGYHIMYQITTPGPHAEPHRVPR